MKTRLVTQYQCEHCGKRGCSASHMAKHERRCTMNPNRECGMCAMIDEKPRPVAELAAMLPANGKEMLPVDGLCPEWTNFKATLEDAMPRLREAVHDCPACIMAALRQASIPLPLVDGFDFTAECKAWWDEFNERQLEGVYFG